MAVCLQNSSYNIPDHDNTLGGDATQFPRLVAKRQNVATKRKVGANRMKKQM